MSTEKEKKSSRNFVLAVGFLKETTLELKSSSDGRRFISGNVTVAVDEFNTHRVRFLVFEDQLKDKFDAVEKFLPNNVVSIASYLKANPTANFAVASGMAAKVWVTGTLEEYAKIKGENETSSITLAGAKIGFSDPEKFEPKATFEVEGVVASIADEVVDEKATGRVNLGLYIPAYKELIYKADFVVNAENNAAKYVKEKFAEGDSLLIKGNLVAMVIKTVNEETDDEEDVDSFGDPITPQYTTRFVREMVVTGGKRVDDLLTKKQITAGLVARTELATSRGKAEKERALKKAAAAEETHDSIPSAAPAANKDDFDF